MDERFLIMDTAHRQGWVALAKGEVLLGVRRLQEARRHVRDLVPMAGELLNEQGWKAKDLTGVIVSQGPGSYTGLRVGIMAAKTLAYATSCRLLGVHTFAAIKRQAPAEAAVVDVIADAQQRKIYVQRFARGQAGPLEIKPFSEWRDHLDAAVCVTGPGLEIHGDALPAEVCRLPIQDWLPRPESLLALGFERFQRGDIDDPFALEPIYLRASSAEEKWATTRRANP